MHVDQHSILEGLKEYGYAGIDQHSKVRLLIDGIKTKDLDPVKTRIMSDVSLRNDFAGCVTLYKDFIAQASTDKKLLVASTNTQRTTVTFANGTKGGQGDQVKDRYYSRAEYSKLSKQQKLALKKLHEKHSQTKRKRGQQELSNIVHSIKAIKAKLSATTLDDDPEHHSSDDSETPPKKTKSNHDNPALTCQKDPKKDK